MVEIKDVNNQEINKILVKKEELVAVLPKGRLVVRKPRKTKSDKEKLADALKRAHKKLGADKATSMKAQWDCMSTGRGGKYRLVGDGLITSMLKMGLSYNS